MNVQSNAAPKSPLDAPPVAPVVMPAMTQTRLLVWSVRRELWENRSIYIVPLVAAAVVLLGFLISTMHRPDALRAVSALDPARQAAALAKSYGSVAMVIIVTTLIVAVFYCLDALYGERRDRTILFWKSLPVSDLTTVLSKASIPLVILPLITFAVVLVTLLILFLASTAVVLSKGMSLTMPWIQLPLFQMPVVVLYGLFTLALWHAPIYGWLLLVSAWARRTTFLWAVLPPLALVVIEKIAFGTTYVGTLLKYRLMGGFPEAFGVTMNDGRMIDGLPPLDPIKFVTSPGLWIGLFVAAALLAATMRLRRYRDPI